MDNQSVSGSSQPADVNVESSTTNGTGLNVQSQSEQTIPKARFDEVYSELKSYKEKEAAAQVATANQPQDPGIPEESKAQREYVKGLYKLVGTEELEATKKELKEELARERAQERFDEGLARTIDTLQKEFPGENGDPKFDQAQVMQYAQQTGNYNLRDAFIMLNKEAFDKKLIEQALKGGGATYVESPTSAGTSEPSKETSVPQDTPFEKLSLADKEKYLAEMEKTLPRA